jgi:hypothetical protein
MISSTIIKITATVLCPQRCQSEADDEPDKRFEFDPQAGLDHQGIGWVEELRGVTGVILPGNQQGRSFELRGRDLR